MVSLKLVPDDVRVDEAFAELQRDGIVILRDLIPKEQLVAMQRAFNARLKRVRWNDFEGYERERYRHVISDLLTLDQGFLDIALHPIVKETIRRYLGDSFELVEAKGWMSVPTKRDFHGWHGDAWYDQKVVDYIPKEIKLAVYLTDVTSGAFNYMRGSQQKQHPQYVSNASVASMNGEIIEVLGPAGTAFLFDTTGVHRQSVPILEPRQALFYDYHDPSVRLEPDNVNYRYHPLILNAAFLGKLSPEDQKILGFGNKHNFVPAHQKPGRHETLQRAFTFALDIDLRARNLHERVIARLKRTFKR
jgi:Phytanoyl-CoA dioxygenase (PhyH)